MRKENAKEKMLKTIQKRKEEREKQMKLEEERNAQQQNVTQEQIDALLNEEWVNEPLSKKQQPMPSKSKKKKKNKK